MGMGVAFTGAADFSKMIDGGGVQIDDVIHKAFVEVNEQGTEAAAVTVVVILDSASQITTVNVNRPFFLVIRDNQTKSILFMGKVVNPEG
jgi:serpin B